MPGPLGYRNPLSRFEVTMLAWCESLVRGCILFLAIESNILDVNIRERNSIGLTLRSRFRRGGMSKGALNAAAERVAPPNSFPTLDSWQLAAVQPALNPLRACPDLLACEAECTQLCQNFEGDS
ncbi:hypothetical protein TNCV_2042621 [Trichonephila clavipes]|nr:hypothetical protein TNCV_2042621 [Trichonephila clavipes]